MVRGRTSSLLVAFLATYCSCVFAQSDRWRLVGEGVEWDVKTVRKIGGGQIRVWYRSPIMAAQLRELSKISQMRW